MKILRRSFLGGAAAFTVGGLGVGLSRRASGANGFGALVTDPEGVLDLPPGFSYVRLQVAGATMSDGQTAAALPDGMACFADGDRNYVLMRNHEVDLGPNTLPELAFDTHAIGGVSRVVIERGSLTVLSSNLVLTGTIRNCAGGPSPWGWLSCEESEDEGHGFVFLCSTEAISCRAPQRIRSYGRFKHEAVAIDPGTAIAYLTEDLLDGALYRHVPHDVGEPFAGMLEALAIVGTDRFGTSTGGVSVGDRLDVRWVPVADPEALTTSTRAQAQAKGAALFSRGEGIWYADGSVFFSATSGGPVSQGQVWRLDVDEGDAGVLTLIAQAEGDGELISPDNLTVSPWGDLFVCEDNDGPNHVRGVTPEGEVYTFARNAHEGGVSEFCGVCFSPDGEVMFVNLQEPGFTLAITGPFPNRRGCGCG